MKTFSQFKEDIDSMKDTMKGFADTIVPQMKKFAKSDDLKKLKKDAMNLLINKGLLNWMQSFIALIIDSGKSFNRGDVFALSGLSRGDTRARWNTIHMHNA